MNLRKLVKRAEEIENELSGALQNIGKNWCSEVYKMTCQMYHCAADVR